MIKSRVHIGNEIKKVLNVKGIKKAQLARFIGVRPQSIDYLLTRKSIDTDTLFAVSQALDYDFSKLFTLTDNQTNCDKEISTKITNAKVVVEIELTRDDIKKLDLEKRVSLNNEQA
ncbi:MAG: helix-turn-helix transcriptional regulator [Muribaculaceae bacterium]|nr:helix-turn-helix transcriptional regulator [Muribaculaceae bacterium]